MAQRPSSWTAVQKEWALGTITIITQLNGDRFELLAGRENPAAVAARDQKFLVELWHIKSREDLLREIYLRFANMQDAARIGWNYPLLINLARCGFVVGYLRQDEAWEIIMPAAQLLQQTFSSWQEMGRAYLKARKDWNAPDIQSQRKVEWAYRTVALDPNGPWRKYAWNLDIGGNQQITTNPEKAAWIMINPHRDGLICVRLGVPDHTDAGEHSDKQYLAAIERTIGCHPRVTRNKYDKDWTLDAECELNSAVSGNQLIARFRLGEIASELKREGVTELFSYIQHEPYGVSELVPLSYDGYFQDGLQWYIERRSLKTLVSDVMLTYGFPQQQVKAGIDEKSGNKCTVDETGDSEPQVDGAALDFIDTVLGNYPARAYDSISPEARKALTPEQLTTAAGWVQQFHPHNVAVQHLYVIELGANAAPPNDNGASSAKEEVPERIVCGSDPEKPDVWVSVAITRDPQQAYVIASADSVNHELALTIWLARQQKKWMVHGFSFSIATLGDKGPVELWDLAHSERLRGHQLNSALLFAAAEDLADRGPYLRLGIQSRILQDAASFVKPDAIAGLPPYLWRTDHTAWKVRSVGLAADGGKTHVVISHEVAHWQSDQQVDDWNRTLLAYFKNHFPEYAEVFSGVVAIAYEQGTKRSHRTVDEEPPPAKPSLVARRRVESGRRR